MSGCDFVPAGEVLKDFVVVLSGLRVVACLELNFGEIEASVSGEVGVGIELEVVRKLLCGQIGLAGSVVAEAVVVEDVGRRGLLLLLRGLRHLGGLGGLGGYGLLRGLQVV